MLFPCGSEAHGARVPGSGPGTPGITYSCREGTHSLVPSTCLSGTEISQDSRPGVLDVTRVTPGCVRDREVRGWVLSQVAKGHTEVKALRESARREEAGPRGTAPGWGPESPTAGPEKSLASRTSRAGWPGSLRREALVMACRAAERGPEPPDFQRHPEAIAPRLAQGYRLHSTRELRDLEFGRLAGEGRVRGHEGTRGAGTCVRGALSHLGRTLYLISAKRSRRDGLLGNRKSGRNCERLLG